MSECPRAARLFSGCRFEGRYDLGKPDVSCFSRITGYDLPEVLRASRPKTYVHDICVRCGKVVERTPTNPNRSEER